MAGNAPAIRLEGASLELGGRMVWRDLSLEVRPGEFIAVLGPNGSGKTSFLKVLLGINELASGTVEVSELPPAQGRMYCGYVPQQRSFDPDLPVRGRDIVRFGLDGQHYGWKLSKDAEIQVDRAIREVGAEQFADSPIGLLSGGEQQRLRIAQALIGNPRVLLCDEPLLSLDLAHQQAVTGLIDQRRRESETAVIFVTHEINPVLPLVDRVLYLVNGRWAIGEPKQVLMTQKLTELYGAPVDVLNVRGRIVVVGSGEAALQEAGGHHHTGHDGGGRG